MFKYTPNKQLLRDMQVRRTGCHWDKEYFKGLEILAKYDLPQEYTLSRVLREDFSKVQYYSVLPRECIPVRGYLFPASMFDVEII